MRVDAYCCMYGNKAVRCEAEIIGDVALQIDCLECGGTGWWGFGPDEEEQGTCVQCKGTGKQYLGM